MKLAAGPLTPLTPNGRLRFDLIRRVLLEIDAGGSFVEVGCGGGGAGGVLAKEFDYVGYEPDAQSFVVARRRLTGIRKSQVFNAVLPDVPSDSFDLLGAFEVLEHVEEDTSALASWVRWLRPGGYAVVSVPAHPQRYGPSDASVGHFRRYTRQSITDLLIEAGLVDVKVAIYGFPLGYGLEWVRNMVASRKKLALEDVDFAERTATSGRLLQPNDALAPLIWLITFPFQWLQRPFVSGDLGTGFVAWGRRPG